MGKKITNTQTEISTKISTKTKILLGILMFLCMGSMFAFVSTTGIKQIKGIFGGANINTNNSHRVETEETRIYCGKFVSFNGTGDGPVEPSDACNILVEVPQGSLINNVVTEVGEQLLLPESWISRPVMSAANSDTVGYQIITPDDNINYEIIIAHRGNVDIDDQNNEIHMPNDNKFTREEFGNIGAVGLNVNEFLSEITNLFTTPNNLPMKLYIFDEGVNWENNYNFGNNNMQSKIFFGDQNIKKEICVNMYYESAPWNKVPSCLSVGMHEIEQSEDCNAFCDSTNRRCALERYCNPKPFNYYVHNPTLSNFFNGTTTRAFIR